ncbi:hypothetical protein N5C16_06110 [Stenotrophomonas sp. GD03908]|uniref:Immunity MXAN-0049 protein domain-containing protein n=1 Tax=Stenotrophomonas maltophilia TaxID=40324 RepID=A0AAJ2WJN5_STEMA|nr:MULTISPECIES: DUF1629 domain-containing protein [Stenotrophomonas]MBH1480899.1 hypothetical protein [Stenotrophomonas maltophilia]MCU1061831.1 hypothetical protein [Stenotrophomonas maltophilia]MDH0978826.1 hypothetical protein [Stenotrophomonas sp. GD03908]MDQ7294182.1 hypothetical protein [Stenotrophomonas sp. Sm0041]MDZ5764941.1 hypothetical protein [Stenotrophomonas maltophilia]
MGYLLTTVGNSYGLLNYAHDESEDYLLFRAGIRLEGLEPVLSYQATSRAALKRLRKHHIVSSTGPDLVSRELRTALEALAPSDVEFFDAAVVFGDDVVEGYSAINIPNLAGCCDMTVSEYELTNFDPANPSYMFLYTVIREESPDDFDVVRCRERPASIIVSNRMKEQLMKSGLSGLAFCRSLDLTPQGRTIYEYC